MAPPTLSVASPLYPSPGQPQPHYIISSSYVTPGDPSDLSVTPAEGFFVPMAIPLCCPRINSSPQQEVTSPATAPATWRPAEHQGAEQLNGGATPPPASQKVSITVRKNEEEDDEGHIFPGADFLCVTDVTQEEEEEEEVSVLAGGVVELDSGPSPPPPVRYQGPVFPPQAPPGLPAWEQASVLGSVQQQEALESRLVDWVEQELMSRMISEMYRPPPPDPALNDSTDQSQLEQPSLTSDIVEAAGGAGLQLFVDAGVSVDSAVIRQLVHEVLLDMVDLMLGQRDTLEPRPEPEPGLEPPKPGLPVHEEERHVPTPVPTPPHSPIRLSRETTPMATPPLSERTSLLNGESPQPVMATERVLTPTLSPEPEAASGSPHAAHLAPPPLPRGDAELPLAEEQPEEDLDPHTQSLMMSVEEAEPPQSSLTPLSPPGPDPCGPASPCSPSEDSSSSSSSSGGGSGGGGTVAGADSSVKHISEGELLLSVRQLAAMTEEVSVSSFCSSLQDMDFDPPSEGQVKGHDLLLTLLGKMEQEGTHTETRPEPEGSWGREEEEEVSVGEVREDTIIKPARSRKSASKSTAGGRSQSCSPGQISQST
ncbi:hypothetical protein LDENG_00139900, partial [Lucifuga dentata]